MRKDLRQTLVLLIFLSILGAVSASAQSLVLPSPAAFANGEGDCKEMFVGIASPNWRVRKGDLFEVSAVHPLSSREGLTYAWQVSNGKIVSGQGTPKIGIKAGGAKTPGFINASGLVSISLRVTKTSSNIVCSVDSTHKVMIGRIRESNSFANVNEVTLDEARLVLQCPPGVRPREGQDVSEDMVVRIRTMASDLENDPLSYAYFVSGGTIVGSGASVVWDLTGVDPGIYSLVAGVDDGHGIMGKTVLKRIAVESCNGCGFIECPTITITGPQALEAESVFTANVSGGSQDSVSYDWSVVGGEIVEGQGTPSILVRIHTKTGGSVTVRIGGLDPRGSCIDSATNEFENVRVEP